MHVRVIESVLKLNDDVARENRRRLKDAGIFTLDLIGGPGCGKTLLLEKTLAALCIDYNIAVIVGDLATARDGQRLGRFCEQVVQINTGKGCHLEAHHIRQALTQIDLQHLDLLIIENVGNLVCPVAFDLGQDAKVGMFCTTEGHDKPAKYPHLVLEADLLLLNKLDLLDFVDFDLDQFHNDIRRLKPDARILDISAHTNKLAAWFDWLTTNIHAVKWPHEAAAAR